MEEVQNVQQVTTEEVTGYALNLLLRGKNNYEVKTLLMQRGIDEETAASIIDSLEYEIIEAKRTKAKKDMLYGALWCIGGTALTMADVGFIFWGAIVFGGIQFFRGVSNLN